MSERTIADRAGGALMGAFIGDALALGPHWYYDLDEMRRRYGEWIDGYTTPRADHYHAGLAAGDASQAGLLLAMTAESLVACDGYDESDFCRRLDEDLFPRLDGSPMSGPGGYTSQSIRECWRKRVEQGLPWGRCGGSADTTEAIERGIALAVRYARDPRQLAISTTRNTMLTQTDESVVAMSVAFCSVLGLLVAGAPLDAEISGRLMTMCKDGRLPFHTVTSGTAMKAPAGGEKARIGSFASPDALLTPSFVARAAADPSIRIEPAWKVSLVYGMPCAIYHQLPAAYYLAARFRDDFESTVLHAVNGGGQNLARAMLAGALAGAQVGLGGIPRRFIDGLADSRERLELCERLAAQA
ncbi:MAG: ADP-ribosylglycohydrolase family protein [Rhodocyclaceae bacterium]|nr:ADP-ribosylglycohydrolase family protein [Rhodocyclaceae bacterium]